MKRKLLFPIITVIVCTVIWVFYPREEVKVVRCIKPELTDITYNVSARGTIEQIYAANLYPSEYAIVEKIYLNVGDEVKKGQVIMSLQLTETVVPEKQEVSDLLIDVLAQAVQEDENYVTYSNGMQIVSPIDGVISEILVKENGSITPITKCAVVSDISRMQAKVAVSESDIYKIKKGMPASITGQAFSGIYNGVVLEISRLIKSQLTVQGEGERYADVTIEILNSDSKLLPGSSVQAYIFTVKKHNVLTLPYEAIIQDNMNREAVYVVENGKIEKRIIKTGYEMTNSVEVTSGLLEGSAVVISPDDGLSEGDRVVVIE